MSQSNGVPKVGALLQEGVERYDAMSDYNFWKGGHTLVIAHPSITKGVVRAVQHGECAHFCTTIDGILYFGWRYGKPSQPRKMIVNLTGVSVYQWHNVPEENRMIPPRMIEEDRAILMTVLVEANTGVVTAVRHTSFSHRFCTELHKIIQHQAHMPPIPDFAERVHRTFTVLGKQKIEQRATAVDWRPAL